jgi:tetratricopeptide (TPR) repeat protein
MRFPAVCGLIVVGALALDARTGAHAAGWCAQYHNGGTNCGFSSQGQCLETVRGIGGHCGPDYSSGSVERSPPSIRLQQARPKEARPSREPERKPVAAIPRNKPAPQRDAAEQPKPAAPAPVAEPASQVQQAVKAFAAARVLILTEKYEAGIAAMRALGDDNRPDVAVSIGFANARLGRLDEARLWYEKALVADPNHVSALASYGLLRVQQGDVIKARDNLERVKVLCGGTGCREYQDLAAAIAAPAR